jgi:hypothetical protein
MQAGSPIEGILVAPVLAFMGSLFLAPLLVICAIAGVAWAFVLRGLVPDDLRGQAANTADAAPIPIPGVLLIAFAIFAVLGWFAVFGSLLLAGPGFVD